MGKQVPRLLLIFIFYFLYFSQISAIGLKIIKQYSDPNLSDAMPWQIEADNGWVFIASEEGLTQYDGNFSDIFPLNNHRTVRSVNIDKDSQKIFAGGINEFGYFQPSPIESLEYICLSDSIGADKNIGNIWGIYYDNGMVYAQGDTGIVKYDTNSNSHILINSEYKLDSSDRVNDILWLGTDDGLKILLGSNIIPAPGTEALKGKRIRRILPYGNGYIVVASDGIWGYENQKLTHLSQYDSEIKTLGEIFSADINGNHLALGSVANGIGILNLTTGELRTYDENHGLPSNTVISLKFDDDENLLVGMQYGVSKLLLNQPIETIDNSMLPIGSGYVLAHKNGKLYMGTNRGVFSADLKNYNSRIGAGFTEIEGLQGQVWGLDIIDGDLFCSHDKGLFIINDNQTSRRIGDFTGVWDVQRIPGKHDKAYAGTYSGLYLLQKTNGTWNVKSHIDGLNESIYNFVQESPSVIWTNKSVDGVARVEIDTANNQVKEIINFKETDEDIPLTSEVNISRIDNDVYFSTSNGIYIYDKSSGKIIKESQISNLLGAPGHVKRVKKTNGSLYALTDYELIQADPAGILDMKRVSLNPSESRPMHEQDVIFDVGNDYIGFPVRNGFLFYDYSNPDNFAGTNETPDVRISFVMVTNGKDSLIYRGNYGNIKLEPELTQKENSIRITYGNIDDMLKGVRYSTHLNNQPWSIPSATVSKEFSNLKEGKYKFEVKAITPDGKESTDSFTFRVSPPWWRTEWMLLVYALMLISLVFVLFRAEQIRVNKKNLKLVAEKEKEIELQKLIHQQETEEKDRHIEALERDRFERELKHKAQEVANVMMSLSHKNETLQTVKRELQNILHFIPRGNAEARKMISSLQEKVVVDINSDDVLKRVEDEFDLIHDNFMKKLREKYPDLNNNEILLCAYLKMNLSTKEIAPLLNISQRGVETLRYRLRKKLSLEREESLATFITNFV